MASLREFTKQQFSDGTTIDGDRLEKALLDLERWTNDIPDGDFRRRWMQSQLVMKYLPPTLNSDIALATNTAVAGNFRHAPFLPIYNHPTDENPFRLKGTALDYQDGYTEPTSTFDPTATPPVYTPDVIYNDQVVWTSCLAVGADPVIIDSADLYILSYSTEYYTDWLYGAAPPPGKTTGQSVDDIHIEVTMDNAFLPNVQESNTVLLHKYKFKAEAVKFSTLPVTIPSAGSGDMVPSLTGVTAMTPLHERSLAINVSDMNIPVPPYSRLRFSLVLPFTSYTPWNDRPWRNGIPTMTLTLLERLVRG